MSPSIIFGGVTNDVVGVFLYGRRTLNVSNARVNECDGYVPHTLSYYLYGGITLISLTDYEKELIGIILDYEKASFEFQVRVQIALTGEFAGSSDLVDFSRIKRALRLDNIGDTAVDAVFSYLNGEITQEDVFELIEIAMNDDHDAFTEWWTRHEQ